MSLGGKKFPPLSYSSFLLSLLLVSLIPVMLQMGFRNEKLELQCQQNRRRKVFFFDAINMRRRQFFTSFNVILMHKAKILFSYNFCQALYSNKL